MSVSLSITSTPPPSPPPELTEQINALIQAGQIEPLADLLWTALSSLSRGSRAASLAGLGSHQTASFDRGGKPLSRCHSAEALGCWFLQQSGHRPANEVGVPEAYQAFAAAIRIQPEFVHALANAGFTLGRLGRSDEALPLSKKPSSSIRL